MGALRIRKMNPETKAIYLIIVTIVWIASLSYLTELWQKLLATIISFFLIVPMISKKKS